MFVSIFNNFKLDDTRGIKQLKLLIDIHKPKLIIFDSMVRCMIGEEDKSKDVRVIFDNLKPLLNEYTDICFVMLHHTTKGATKRKGMDALRGSGDFAAFSDIIMMFNATSPGFVDIDIVKNRHIDRALLPGFTIKIETDEEENLKLSYLEQNPDAKNSIDECKADIQDWYSNEKLMQFKSKQVTRVMIEQGNTKNAVYSALKLLEEGHQIVKQKRGSWEVKDTPLIDEDEDVK